MIPQCIFQGFPNHVLRNRRYLLKQVCSQILQTCYSRAIPYKESKRLCNKYLLVSLGASQMWPLSDHRKTSTSFFSPYPYSPCHHSQPLPFHSPLRYHACDHIPNNLQGTDGLRLCLPLLEHKIPKHRDSIFLIFVSHYLAPNSHWCAEWRNDNDPMDHHFPPLPSQRLMVVLKGDNWD